MGARRTVNGSAQGHFDLNADDLVTHGVVVGMTGSGKTGLVTVLVEEALRNGDPGAAPRHQGRPREPQARVPELRREAPRAVGRGRDAATKTASPTRPLVDEIAATRKKELTKRGDHRARSRALLREHHVRVITPGQRCRRAAPSLERARAALARWDHDLEGARATLEAAVSMVLAPHGPRPRSGAEPGACAAHAIAERRHVSEAAGGPRLALCRT
jgi:hypothetical protein